MYFAVVTSLFVSIIIKQCHSANLKLGCRADWDQMVLDNHGSYGGCKDCHKSESIYLPRCQTAISALERIQSIGMFHTYKSLLSLNQTITIGGHLIVPNLQTRYKRECNLKGFKKCTKREWLDEKRWCFNNQEEHQLLNYSQHILGTQSSMKYVSSVVDQNWKLLPFPNLFNVTILDVKPLKSCRNSQPIACHMTLENSCLFYMCHTDNTIKLIQLTVGYKQLKVDLIMTCHLESIKHYKSMDRLYFILQQHGGQDTLCHLASPQTNFYLCEN
jgi:hypothetical protein